MAETADRDANHALRARFDDVHGQYRRLRSGMDEIQRRLASLQASAESADGLVRATVGARGQLIGLRLDRRIYSEADEVALGQSIVATVQQAAAQATGQVEELMAAYLPADSGPMRFLQDNDLGSLLRRSDAIMDAGDE